MCGRFYYYTPEKIFETYEIPEPEWFDLVPDYNVAPTEDSPVITRDKDGNHIKMFRWGLIPSWAKDAKIGYKMINARVETLMEKPTWRRPFLSQRALIPVSGFYEWKKEGGLKMPYAIRSKEREIVSFAGLYDVWKDPEGKEMPTFSIITRSSAGAVADIHERMPVILNPKGEEVWLDSTVKDPDLLRHVMDNEVETDLEGYRVSNRVNKAGENNPELVERV